MKYTEYNILDFLSDEFFIQWVKRPDKNNHHFWEKWLQQHPEKRDIVLEAASIIRSVKYANSPELSDEMYVDAFENIVKAGNQKRKKGPNPTIWFLFYPLKYIAAFFLLGFCGWMIHHHMLVDLEPVIPMVVEENIIFRSVQAGKKSIITLAEEWNSHLRVKLAMICGGGELRVNF